MNPTDRLWSVGAAVLAIGIAAGVWFGAVSPELDRAAVANADREAAEHQNTLHETRLLGLEEDAARMGELLAERDELAEGIPADVRYSAFMRELNTLAERSEVALVGLTTGDPEIYAPPVDEAAPAPVEPAAEDAAASGSASAGGVDGAAAAAESDLSTATQETPAPTAPTVAPGEPQFAPAPYADPRITSDNFAAIPFTVAAAGDTDSLAAFLQRLQMGDRLVSISGVTFGEGSETEPPKVDISGYLYVLHSEAVAP